MTTLFRTYHYDFKGEHRERNWDIYRMRVVEKRTLDSIGMKYGLSRERVRQIVAKGERITYRRAWIKEEAERKSDMVMEALNIPVAVLNVLGNMGVLDMPLKDFVKSHTPAAVLREYNCGRKKLRQLIAAIEEIDPDVSNIWTAGHGQNYNPAKHG